jgi:GNAT superfamily N-acetyltransferase
MKPAMPADTLAFRDYRPEDKAIILALLAAGKPARYAAEKRAVFDWQFLANPQAAGRSPFVVGTIDDDIVAVNGLVPVSARAGGEPVAACWSLDTYLCSNHRGRGFGKSLLERVTAHAPLMLGFGISDMSDPIFAKLGWQQDPTMAAMFFHANDVGLKGLSKNLSTRLARALRARGGRCAAEFAVECPPPMAELTTLWTGVLSHYPDAVERNGAYLTWRYRDAPVLRYRWVVARQHGELRALLITRHHPVESVVVDYVGRLDEPDLLFALIDFACGDLVEMGTRRIRCEANHPALLRALGAAGFRRYRTAGRFRVHAQAGTAWTPSSHWFVMTGDSDNDLLAL